MKCCTHTQVPYTGREDISSYHLFSTWRDCLTITELDSRGNATDGAIWLHTTMATSEHAVPEISFVLSPLPHSIFLSLGFSWKPIWREGRKLVIHCVLRLHFLKFGWLPNTASYGQFRMDELRKVSSGQYWNETHPTTIEMQSGELSILKI